MAVTIVCVLANFCPANARADLVTFAYEGAIDNAVGGAAFDAFLGQTIRIDYTFESTTSDGSGDTDYGDCSDPTGQVTLTVGSNDYVSSGVVLSIFEDSFFAGTTTDGYVVEPAGVVTGPAIGAGAGFVFFLDLSDSTHTAFTSDALPLIQPDPNAFDTELLQIEFRTLDGALVGSLASSAVSIASVPEPSAFACCALVSLVLGVTHRRWRRVEVRQQQS